MTTKIVKSIFLLMPAWLLVLIDKAFCYFERK